MLEALYDSQIDEIKKIVMKNTNVNIDRYKTPFLIRRINSRMHSTGIKSSSEYISFLRKNSKESLEFNTCFSINVTEFFRDKLVWEYFQQKIIPEIIKNSNNFETIQVWSAGCATGNEPYSLAMMLSNVLENSTKQFLVTANDINLQSIDIAKNGQYNEKMLHGISNWLRVKFMKQIDDDLYQFNDDLKKFINFQVGDIASFPIKNMDVIVCRNLMIYYTDDAKVLMFKKFHRALKDDGFLVIGLSEIIPTSMEKYFKSVALSQKIYKKNHLKIP